MAPSEHGHQAFASTLTDLMTSLAVIFILLLVVFLKQAHEQGRKTKDQLHEQLGPFLEQKSLALRQDPDDPLRLIVVVNESQLRFPLAGYTLSKEGAEFMDAFAKNFATKICDDKLEEKIDSIVVEGHTDTSGERTDEGVKNNIVLSQKRSYSVLEQVLRSVHDDTKTYECLLKLVSANGRGSRSPIFTDGSYNADLSRRVEIKIRVRSAEQQFRALADSAIAPTVK